MQTVTITYKYEFLGWAAIVRHAARLISLANLIAWRGTDLLPEEQFLRRSADLLGAPDVEDDA